MKKRIVAFDFCRSISMIWIVCVWHLDNYTNLPAWCSSNCAEQVTWSMLAVFVFISGYLNGLKTFKNRDDVVQFYLKRLVKIYPLYFFACLLFYVFKIYSGLDFIKAIIIFDMIFYPKSMPMTMWFIGMIFYFYVLTPFVKYSYSKWVKRIAIILILVILYYCAYGMQLIDSRMFIFAPFYFGGCLLSDKNVLIRSIVHHRDSICLLTGCIAVILLYIQRYEEEFSILTGILSIAFIITLTCLGLMIYKKGIERVVLFISRASMCAYLYHRVLYALLFRTQFFENLGVVNAVIVIILAFYIQYAYDWVASKVYGERTVNA